MDRKFGDYHFTSSAIADNNQGFAGLELNRISGGTSDRIATVLYWDACGQFFVETFGADVPLQILEELIAEAKSSIRTG
jgi:hypothetical protein